MILSNSLLLISILQIHTIDSTPEYKEDASDTIRYHPHNDNKLVLGHGTRDDGDGLVLRHDKDNGGFVYFTGQNKSKDWSFEYTIKDFDFHFPEEAGIYLWYTKQHQDIGAFKGVNGHFEGLMAGIEFKGAYPELIMTVNEGFKMEHGKEAPLLRDAFDPERLKGVKELTIKVIVTEKNFKIELYDGKKIIYDSLRFIYEHPFGMLGEDKKFTLSTFYKDVSAERSFKLTHAQLYKRDESDHYDAEKIHASNIGKTGIQENEINHPDKEMRHFIAKFYHFIEYMHTVLGEPNKPLLEKFSKEIIAKIDDVKNNSVNGENHEVVKQGNMVLGRRINGIELQIQRLQKDFTEFEHFLRTIEENHTKKSDYISYGTFVVGVVCIVVMTIREYYSYQLKSKKL